MPRNNLDDIVRGYPARHYPGPRRQSPLRGTHQPANGQMSQRRYAIRRLPVRHRAAKAGGSPLSVPRHLRGGPSFVKIGKAVLYPVDELDAWDEKNKVQCRASKELGEHSGDQA